MTNFHSLLLALVSSRCPESWTPGPSQKRCYKNFGSSVFENASAKCETEKAHVISILSEEENQFFRDIGPFKFKSKWLGIKPSKNHPTEIFTNNSILWMDFNYGNYTNFDSTRNCPVGGNCCVHQFVDGTWGFTDCDYQYEVWCYITFDESHKRLLKVMDEHIKNATRLMKEYPAELMKSENLDRLSAILREIRDALEVGGKVPLSSNVAFPAVAMALSIAALMAAIIALLKSRKRKRTKIPMYNGIARASFNYSQRESCPPKSETTEVNFGNDYEKPEKDIRISSFERGCTRHIDSPVQYESSMLTDFVTSEPQDV